MSIDAPLAAAKRGWYVHPLDHPSLSQCVGIGEGHDPATCVERGKHPATAWGTWATTDQKAITAKFSGRTRNYGIACGPSKLVVVDADKPGEFERWAADHGHTIPATYTVRTAHGRHWYFQAPGVTIGNKDGMFAGYAINVRGAGGYVVGAGSTHQTGIVYTAENDLDPAPMPQWLIDTLTGDDQPFATVSGPFELPERITSTITDGAPSRDEVLYKYACSLQGRGVPKVEALASMQHVAFPRVEQPDGRPYPLRKALGKVEQAYQQYGDASPNGKAAAGGENSPPGELPPLIRLDEFLATPDEDLTYRVHQLWPAGGRVILAAAWKAGKTTLLGNLIRALVDDQPFLGHYGVQPARRVVLIDDELDQRTLRRWLREQNIADTTRVDLVALRGKVSTFDIIDDATRARWAQHIGPADVLLLDCLRPILDALGLDESHDAGKFLVAFDALLTEAGIAEAGIAHHMGHAGERSRGDSRLRDWPDVEWRLVRDRSNDDGGETDAAAPRYFAAYGRDVDQPEQLLGYDQAARRLTIAGGSRKDAKVEALIDAVVEYVEANPGCSQNAIEQAVDGRAVDVRKARDVAAERGRINAEKVGNKWIHTPTSSTRPDSSGRTDEPLSSPRPLVLYEDEDEDVLDGQRGEINPRDEDEQPSEDLSWIDGVADYLDDGAA